MRVSVSSCKAGVPVELLFIIAAVVAFFWWRSRSRAALRYQAHKDALDAGRALLSRFASEQAIQSIPLEYRHHARTRLEDIKAQIEHTMVPAQLGDARLFRELLEDVTWVQMAATGNVPADGRIAMRAITFSEIFTMVEHWIEAHDNREPGRHLYDPDEILPIAAEALSWFGPNDGHPQLKVQPSKAARLYARAQELAEKTRLAK